MNSTEAFVAGQRTTVTGSTAGPLAGLGFAVKDLIDIAGVPTHGGNPDWSRYAGIPTRHAWVVETLLAAGASVVGKTVTDEVSLGILGENVFDGTPLNPAAPDRVPGGSSSGSASAVAQGVCDFALGTDSGGSVRVPASFCGLYGIRPTHGRIDFSGITVQSPSADTCGWFARDPDIFARVGQVLFASPLPGTLPTRLLIATDAWGFAEESVQNALLPLRNRLSSLIGHTEEVVMATPGLSVWQRAQRVLQSSESARTFAPWLDTCNPRMAFSVARNLTIGSMITDAERSAAGLMRIEAQARLRHLLPKGTILCLPTTPFPAPLKDLPISTLAPLRERISCLTSHGGLTGVPQVSIPGARVDGAPVGLSIIAGRDYDLDLLAVAAGLAAHETGARTR